MHVRTYELPSCWAHEHSSLDGGYIHTVFKADQSSSVFAPIDTEDFTNAMQEMGYADPLRYAVEHELAHHIVAEESGRLHSEVIWRDAHKLPTPIEDLVIASEEHLANQILRFINFGTTDSHGELRRVFGSRVEKVARRILTIARPWLNL